MMDFAEMEELLYTDAEVRQQMEEHQGPQPRANRPTLESRRHGRRTFQRLRSLEGVPRVISRGERTVSRSEPSPSHQVIGVALS